MFAHSGDKGQSSARGLPGDWEMDQKPVYSAELSPSIYKPGIIKVAVCTSECCSGNQCDNVQGGGIVTANKASPLSEELGTQSDCMRWGGRQSSGTSQGFSAAKFPLSHLMQWTAVYLVKPILITRYTRKESEPVIRSP